MARAPAVRRFCLAVVSLALVALPAPPGSGAPLRASASPTTSFTTTPPVETAYASAVFAFRPSAEVTPTQGVHYGTADDGTQLLLDVYLPRDLGPWPAIVLVHGGGWRAGDKTVVSREAQALVAAGFAVFAANYRLAPGNKGDDPWPAQITDLRMAVEYARSQPFVTGMVGSVGVSAGAHLAQYLGATGTRGGTRTDAVGSIAGPSDLGLGNPSNPEYEEAVENLLGCPLEACPDTWRWASPAHRVDARTSPMYLGLSADDPLVVVDHLQRMDARLTEAGVQHVATWVEKSGHIDAVADSLWDEMVTFLRSALGAPGADVTHHCSLDGAPSAPCRSPVRLTQLAPGGHSFSVRSTDSTGTAGSYRRWSWTISRTVEVGDSGYVPALLSTDVGAMVSWSFRGPGPHSVTDDSGLGRFDSGTHPAGSVYKATFQAAGAYTYRCTVSPTMRGTIRIPVSVTPAAGEVGSAFTISWAAGPPPAGHVYDVQVQPPGVSGWEPWRSGTTATSATFVPTTDRGTYRFRARTRALESGSSSAYSLGSSLTAIPVPDTA